MSSAIYLSLKDEVKLEDWQKFCSQEEIEHSPYTVGGNVYYFGGLGGVEIWFGKGSQYDKRPPYSPPAGAREISVKTYWMGRAMPYVAKVAKKIIQRFGAEWTADMELEGLMKLGEANVEGR